MAFGALIPTAGLSSRMGRTLLHRCGSVRIFEQHFSDYILSAQD